MTKPLDEFDYDHLPMGTLSRDQHIEAAVSLFRQAIRLDPQNGLENAKGLSRYGLTRCGLSDEACEAIITIAAKKAMAKEAN